MSNFFERSASQFENIDVQLPGIRTAYATAGIKVAETFRTSNPNAYSITPPLLIYTQEGVQQVFLDAIQPSLQGSPMQYEAVSHTIQTSESVLKNYLQQNPKGGIQVITATFAEECMHAQSTVQEGDILRVGFFKTEGKQTPTNLRSGEIYTFPIQQEEMDKESFKAAQIDTQKILLTENVTRLAVYLLVGKLLPTLKTYNQILLRKPDTKYQKFLPVDEEILSGLCEALYTGDDQILRETVDKDLYKELTNSPLMMAAFSQTGKLFKYGL